MACNSFENDRRNMTISVAALGLTLCVVFLAYFAFANVHIDPDVGTIKFAAVIFRHGERSPTGLYPNDPHKNYSWIGGYGALLPKGALQMYNLGTVIRKRYIKLLPSDGFYSTHKMYVMSSAAERCLMSAQSFLAGFLPPKNDQHKLPISWQPVAVNSVPRNIDRLLSQKADCPKYDKLLHKMYNDPPNEIKEFNKNNAELYAYSSQHTGANLTSMNQLEQLYNILSIEKLNGLQLPKWTESVFPDKLLVVAERNLAVLTETPFMKQIRGGSMVTEIYTNMLKKSKNELKPDRSLFIYSGHDVTLVNIMYALNIIPQTVKKPDYGSALYFELHENPILDDLEVMIFFSFSSSDNDMKPISIPNCEAPCTLNQFGKTIESIYVHDFDKQCKETSD